MQYCKWWYYYYYYLQIEWQHFWQRQMLWHCFLQNLSLLCRMCYTDSHKTYIYQDKFWTKFERSGACSGILVCYTYFITSLLAFSSSSDFRTAFHIQNIYELAPKGTYELFLELITSYRMSTLSQLILQVMLTVMS